MCWTADRSMADCAQIKQPTDSTGVAVYSSSGCTVRDLTLYAAAGFGFYDGTSTGSNSYMYAFLLQASCGAFHCSPCVLSRRVLIIKIVLLSYSAMLQHMEACIGV